MIPSTGTQRDGEPYAAMRYREGMRSWRRKTAPVFAGLLGVPSIAAIAWGLAERQSVGLVCGLCAGVCLGAWVVFRDSPPAYLESWRQGAEGERRTRRELLRLGWHFVEDVPDRRGNFDHVVVGPAGVFHLETKFPSGIAEVVDGSLRLRGRHGEARPSLLDVRGRVLGANASLCREIERHCGQRPWVTGVVVLWSPFPQRVVEAGALTYVHGKELRGWLSRREQTVEAPGLAVLEGALNAVKRQREAAGR